MKQRTELVTRNFSEVAGTTGNFYESTVIIFKRARQIATEKKKELDSKLDEFAVLINSDSKDENDNKEFMLICNMYEKLPKPCLVATEEFIKEELFVFVPSAVKNEDLQKF